MSTRLMASALLLASLAAAPLCAQSSVAPFAGIDNGGTVSLGAAVGIPMPQLQVAGYSLTLLPGASYMLGGNGTTLGFDADAFVSIDQGGRSLYVGAGAHLGYSSVNVPGAGSASATSVALSAFIGTDLGASRGNLQPYTEIRLLLGQGGVGGVVRGGVRISMGS